MQQHSSDPSADNDSIKMTVTDNPINTHNIKGDMVAGDKVSGDKVSGDKITHVHQEPVIIYENINQIPYLPRLFVGREAEIKTLQQWFVEDTVVIANISGMAYIGKTALISVFSNDVKTRFSREVFWLNFRDTAQLESQLATIANMLGHAKRFNTATVLADQLNCIRELLSEEHCLLIIDHASDYALLKHLLPINNTKSNYRVLITSRNNTLLSKEERCLTVKPFNTEQGRLLLQEAFDEEISLQELKWADNITTLVGGHPMALSLIVGHLRNDSSFSLEEYALMLQDFEEQIDLLDEHNETSEVSDSMRAALERSYQTFPEKLKLLFSQLSIFSNNNFDASVIAHLTEQTIGRTKKELGTLSRYSFLEHLNQNPADQSASHRYHLHPLVALFSQLKQTQPLAPLHARTTQYYVDLASKYKQAESFYKLDADWQNIVMSLEWAYRYGDWKNLQKGVQSLTFWQAGTAGFLDSRGQWHVAIKLLKLVLNAPRENISELTKINTHLTLAYFASRQSDFNTAQIHADAAEQLLAEYGKNDQTALYSARLYVRKAQLNTASRGKLSITIKCLQKAKKMLIASTDKVAIQERGSIHMFLADSLLKNDKLDEAISTITEGLLLLPETAASARVYGLNLLSTAYEYKGDINQAVTEVHKAIQLAEDHRLVLRLAQAKFNLANLLDIQGNWSEAVILYADIVNTFRLAGDMRETSGIYLNLGRLKLKLGDPEGFSLLQVALCLTHKLSIPANEALALLNLSTAYREMGNFPQAKKTLSMANAIIKKQKIKAFMPARLYLKAELAIAEEQPLLAIKLAKKAVKKSGDYIGEKGIAQRVLGEAYHLNKQTNAALVAFVESLTLLEGQDRYELACTQLATARLLISNPTVDFPTTSHQLLQEALDIFAKLQASPKLQETQSLMDDQPV